MGTKNISLCSFRLETTNKDIQLNSPKHIIGCLQRTPESSGSSHKPARGGSVDFFIGELHFLEIENVKEGSAHGIKLMWVMV